MNADSSAPRSSFGNWALGTGILLSAFLLRLYHLGAKSFWYDELRQIEVSQLPLNQLSEGLAKHAARPLDYWLTNLTLQAGHQEFWLRFPAALVGALTIAAAYRLGRDFGPRGRRIGLIAAALLAVSAFHVSFSQELRPYAEYALAAALAHWCLWKGLRSGGWKWWAGHALFAALGILAHYFTVFILVEQTLFVGLALPLRWTNWRNARPFLVSLLLAALVLVATANNVSLSAQGSGFVGALLDPRQIPSEGTPPGVAARIAPEINPDFFFGPGRLLWTFGAGAGWGMILFGGLALAGALYLLVRNRRVGLCLLLWLFVGPALVLAFLIFRNAIYGNRYLLFALMPFLLLTATGLSALFDILLAVARHARRPSRTMIRAAPTVLAVALAVSVALPVAPHLAASYRQPKDDWRRVGAFLRANFQPGDVIVAPDVAAFVAFYFTEGQDALVWSLDPGQIESAYSNSPRTWFVLSVYNLVDLTSLKEEIRALPGVDFPLDPVIDLRYFRLGVPLGEMEKEAADFVVPPPSLPPP